MKDNKNWNLDERKKKIPILHILFFPISVQLGLVESIKLKIKFLSPNRHIPVFWQQDLCSVFFPWRPDYLPEI